MFVVEIIKFSRICKMSSKAICSFCSSHVNNENAHVITDTTKEILDILLINLDLSDRSDHTVCNVCFERLLAALEFKSTCEFTDGTIITYLDCEKPRQLDLWEIYLRERDDKPTVTLSEDEQVCRLCMELTGKMYVPLQDIDEDVFQKFLPEINVNIAKEPVVCKTCFDSLATHSDFLERLRNCIDQMEAIKSSVCTRNMDHVDELLPIKMEEVDIKLDDKPSIYFCIQPEQIKSETKCDQMDIKMEVENDETSFKPLISEIHPLTMESKGQTIQTETSRAEMENRNSCANADMAHKQFLKTKIFRCDMCNYKTGKEKRLKSHGLMHKDSPTIQMHKCDFCTYKTKSQSYLLKHQLTHIDPSQVQMHKCDFCTYKTKFQSYLKHHQLVHKDPSEVQMFSCDNCEYRTKFKEDLKMHQMKHKDPSEVQMYKCATCDYETKIKSGLKSHLLKYKDPSEVQMYKCATCDYETKYKSYLKRHLLKHKDLSKVHMFKCVKCSYRSRSKSDCLRHCKSQHRNPS